MGTSGAAPDPRHVFLLRVLYFLGGLSGATWGRFSTIYFNQSLHLSPTQIGAIEAVMPGSMRRLTSCSRRTALSSDWDSRRPEAWSRCFGVARAFFTGETAGVAVVVVRGVHAGVMRGGFLDAIGPEECIKRFYTLPIIIVPFIVAGKNKKEN